MSTSDNEEIDLTKEQLEIAQDYHLFYLENFGKLCPKVDNVHIVLAMNYELIQILNDSFLRDSSK